MVDKIYSIFICNLHSMYGFVLACVTEQSVCQGVSSFIFRICLKAALGFLGFDKLSWWRRCRRTTLKHFHPLSRAEFVILFRDASISDMDVYSISRGIAASPGTKRTRGMPVPVHSGRLILRCDLYTVDITSTPQI